MNFKSFALFLWFCAVESVILRDDDVDGYFKSRRGFIAQEERRDVGGDLVLSDLEKHVNEVMMRWKHEEYEEGLKNESKFWAAQHFFRAKPHIEQSKIFKFIQKLPKGGSLHSHDTAMVSDSYVFENITYRENLYAYEDAKKVISVKFFKNPPGTPWYPISHFRKVNPTFNERLRKQFTLICDHPESDYPDAVTVWKHFQNLFRIIAPLLTYMPVFKDYFYQSLLELLQDNVKYVEFRGLLPELYDLDGHTYGPEEVVGIYYETSRQFLNNHPEFHGIKFIYAPSRAVNETVVQHYADIYNKIRVKYPDFVVGFDLVGLETNGQPLKTFIPTLLKMDSRFFFHAGETVWNGVSIDENLVDAVLLNSTRIGHGYAVLKHPLVLNMVKDKGIGLEICPISNQVLGLVRDLRNHPANFLLANNYPVVIAPDDPSFWGAKGLSYDWYMAFMGMASRHSDLRLLKQLAVNSMVYSSLDETRKEKVLSLWGKDWHRFLLDVLNEFGDK